MLRSLGSFLSNTPVKKLGYFVVFEQSYFQWMGFQVDFPAEKGCFPCAGRTSCKFELGKGGGVGLLAFRWGPLG